MQNMDNLSWISCSSNIFTEIPEVLLNIPNLKEISFSYNDIGDSLPAFLFQHPTLKTVWLYSNDIIGSIPPEIGTSQITKLHLENNNLSGELPIELKDSKLIELDLEYNNLTGTFPEIPTFLPQALTLGIVFLRTPNT